MQVEKIIEKYIDDNHAVLLCDAYGAVLYFSSHTKHMLQLLGLSSMHHLLPRDHIAFSRKVFEDAEHSRNPHPLVIEEEKHGSYIEYVYTERSNYVLVECIDITESRKRETELIQRALYDEVTGIPNRVHFFEDIEREITKAEKDEAYTFGLAFLDLNDFKKMNDVYGHAFGDEYLKMFSLLVSRAADGEHGVYRYAGDEFIIIIRNTRSYEKMTIVLKQVAEIGKDMYTVQDVRVSFAASIGSVLYKKGMTAKSILDAADKAMYESKKRKSVEPFPYTFAA